MTSKTLALLLSILLFLSGPSFAANLGGSASGFGENSLSSLSTNQTVFNSTNSSQTVTFGLSGGNDPSIQVSDGVIDVNNGVLKRGGFNVLTTASIEEVTNKTIDCEATGNVCSFPVRLLLRAAGCNGPTAVAGASFNLPTTAAAAPVCLGTSTTRGVLNYVDGATTAATASFLSGGDWNTSRQLDIALHYTGSVSSSNNIRWRISVACLADGESYLSPTYNTVATSNSAGPTAAGEKKTLVFLDVPKANCAQGENVDLMVERLGDDNAGGDVYEGTAQLVEVVVLLRRTI